MKIFANRNNLVSLEIAQTKRIFKSYGGYLDSDGIRPLSITLPKISGYVKTFDKTNYISFHITKSIWIEKYNYIWRKISKVFIYLLYLFITMNI